MAEKDGVVVRAELASARLVEQTMARLTEGQASVNRLNSEMKAKVQVFLRHPSVLGDPAPNFAKNGDWNLGDNPQFNVVGEDLVVSRILSVPGQGFDGLAFSRLCMKACLQSSFSWDGAALHIPVAKLNEVTSVDAASRRPCLESELEGARMMIERDAMALVAQAFSQAGLTQDGVRELLGRVFGADGGGMGLGELGELARLAGDPKGVRIYVEDHLEAKAKAPGILARLYLNNLCRPFGADGEDWDVEGVNIGNEGGEGGKVIISGLKLDQVDAAGRNLADLLKSLGIEIISDPDRNVGVVKIPVAMIFGGFLAGK